MRDRRAADLRARADCAGPACAWLTCDSSTMRVGDGGGGRPTGTHQDRPGSRIPGAHGAERCLTQCRELECRSHSTTHQLAERALVRSTGGQRGEHVFGKVGAGSDGTGSGTACNTTRFGSARWKHARRVEWELARGSHHVGRQRRHVRSESQRVNCGIDGGGFASGVAPMRGAATRSSVRDFASLSDANSQRSRPRGASRGPPPTTEPSPQCRS